MKVATNQYFNEMTRLLTEQHAEVASLQAKLASGNKVLRPSEDPGASLKILSLNSLLSQQDTQQANLKNLDNRLAQEENAIGGMRDILARIQELAVMGANDTYSADNRKIMAAEIRGYQSQLLNLANTRNSDGSFLFGGTRNSSPPFQQDNNGNISYLGDATRIYLSGAGNQRMEINTTGHELFSGGNNTRDFDLDATQAFAAINALASALESADQALISANIDIMGQLRGNLELAITKIGVRRNVVETQSNIVEEQSTTLKLLLSDQKDLDYTQAITQLSARMLALEAAQSSMAKIAQLNLFNYLR
jgi:flagellar hook-associated protein 3 FlgL